MAIYNGDMDKNQKPIIKKVHFKDALEEVRNKDLTGLRENVKTQVGFHTKDTIEDW